jgi:hypothetical protein
MIVRAILTNWRNRLVYAFLQVWCSRMIFPEEYKTCARTPKRLVRGGGDDITIQKRIVQFIGGDEATEVSYIPHDPCVNTVGNSSNESIIPISRISRSSTNDKVRFEFFSLGSKFDIIDGTSVRMTSV